MLRAGLQFNRSRNGEDRFYSAKARRSQSQSVDFQGQVDMKNGQSDVSVSHCIEKVEAESRDGYLPPKKIVSDKSDQCGKKEGVLVSKNGKKVVLGSSLCNLERFLGSVSPSVMAQRFSETTMRSWGTIDVEFRHYFVLGDLWESFKEWSVYGAGVPLILNDSDSVVQYYVPYLSGIQLYGDSSKSSFKTRQLGEDSDGDYFKDSSSDWSSDCEHERGCSNALTGSTLYQHPTSDVSCRFSSRDQHEGSSSDEGESGSSPGSLLFEYLASDMPYSREPLYDKISQLAVRFPELRTLRSCDLLSSSWISVAWYPIYRIPVGPSLQDLDACFLTFHSLHTPTTGTQNLPSPSLLNPNEEEGIAKISLPVFGLASYKFKGTLWAPNGGYERQLVNSLLQSADNWLALRQVNHPDFLFFRHR
ncbi:hypothetical protein LIER_09533 [Lithospermum erythrorhizon]|uniref:Uncharacterized protein n=1 Tax=Lithospermum erythrorhizon TaxID=34254 RepID=A0AAV3PFY5_LITER